MPCQCDRWGWLASTAHERDDRGDQAEGGRDGEDVDAVGQEILERIAGTAAIGSLSKEDRDEGIAISHKFAGSLGMYGYSRGTEVASAIEHLLRSQPPAQADQLRPLAIQLRDAIFPAKAAD